MEIYYQWYTFEKTISNPQGNKRSLFEKRSREIRERCGVDIWCAPTSLGYFFWHPATTWNVEIT
jgi:hypothetical protein